MKTAAFVSALVIGWLGTARADTPTPPAVCKASSECPANNVCTAEGKCIALPPQQPPADPDPAPPPTPQEQEANLHFKNGNMLFSKGSYEAALVEFKAAQAALPDSVDILVNIGYTQQKLFMYAEALASLSKALEKEPNGPDAEQIKKVIDDIKAIVVDLKLTVLGLDKDKDKDHKVALSIDGREASSQALAKPMPPSVALQTLIAVGVHQIEIKAEGFKPYTEKLTVAAGVPIERRVPLELIPITGVVRINSPIPRAMVSIDGTPRGPVPLEVVLPGGGHTLEISAIDYQTHRGELVVTVGETRDVNIGLDKVVVVRTKGKPWYKKWYVVGPIGAVVVGAGVGTALILTSTPDPVVGTLAPGTTVVR